MNLTKPFVIVSILSLSFVAFAQDHVDEGLAVQLHKARVDLADAVARAEDAEAREVILARALARNAQSPPTIAAVDGRLALEGVEAVYEVQERQAVALEQLAETARATREGFSAWWTGGGVLGGSVGMLALVLLRSRLMNGKNKGPQVTNNAGA